MTVGLKLVTLFQEFSQFGQLVALLPGQSLELLHALLGNEQLYLHLLLLQLLFWGGLRVRLAGISRLQLFGGLLILLEEEFASGYFLAQCCVLGKEIVIFLLNELHLFPQRGVLFSDVDQLILYDLKRLIICIVEECLDLLLFLLQDEMGFAELGF